MCQWNNNCCENKCSCNTSNNRSRIVRRCCKCGCHCNMIYFEKCDGCCRFVYKCQCGYCFEYICYCNCCYERECCCLDQADAMKVKFTCEKKTSNKKKNCCHNCFNKNKSCKFRW